MPTVKNGTLIYVKPPGPDQHDIPGVHTKYVEQEIDLDHVPLNGGVLIQTIAFSADPYQRYRMRDPSVWGFVPPFTPGMPVDNTGVGKVIRSEDSKYQPGDYVLAFMDFQEYAIYSGLQQDPLKHITKIDKVPGIPLSYHCGVLGIAGKTGYGGFKTFGAEKAKTSKTLYVSGAAGPVGTFVIEYAKYVAPHLKVIASAGSPEKIEILRRVGADVPINYKTEDVASVLKEHGPIDIYWDNVSGPTLDAALANMANEGLIIACGAISAASGDGLGSPVMNFEQIFQRNLTVHGFLLAGKRVVEVLETFLDDIIPLILAEKISVFEHRYSLEEAGQAISDLHTGKNVGKAVIIVSGE